MNRFRWQNLRSKKPFSGIGHLFQQHAAQFYRFVFVGALNTAVDLGIFLFLNNLMVVHYIYCQIGGYSAGVFNSFIWNKYWTFQQPKKNQSLLSQFGKFLLVNGVSLLLTLIGLAILIDFWAVPAIAAKLLILFLSQLVNFAGYRFLVFGQK